MNRFSALLLSGLLALTQTVIAQDRPSRPIRVVSPYAAGGVGDTLFRVIAPALEAGFPQLVSGNWWVLSAPKGTESKIIERLAAEVRAALADPAARKRVGELGHVAVGMTPVEAAAFIRAESARYKQILDRSGIKPE